MPVKAAVIEWLPIARVEEVKVALPAVTVAAAASVVVPSVNLTVPVGTLVPTPVIVAVSVMEAPEVDGFAEEVTAVVVVPCTDCDTVPLLVPKPPVPVNAAVIVWVATESVLVVKVALPLVTVTAEASVVAPSVNLTVPVGVPPDELMVAVKVTDCPGPEGVADEATAVVVAPPVTDCESAVLALLPKLPLPVNAATIECVPAARVEVAKVALPAETATFEAKVVAPSVNVTAPVGVPPDEVIVAVNVTEAPDVDGFAEDVRAVEVAAVAVLTVCVSVALLGVPVVGVNVVLMVWLPAARALVVNVA